jgi:hypothetical protein
VRGLLSTGHPISADSASARRAIDALARSSTSTCADLASFFCRTQETSAGLAAVGFLAVDNCSPRHCSDQPAWYGSSAIKVAVLTLRVVEGEPGTYFMDERLTDDQAPPLFQK